ncbi:hypothetical protein OU798_11880 [Prolixibacteraceae bacterium Z1-6]|uniref:Capsule polysaccharide biosynthesis protein n=1 Tax=Draconibacterium aestuarii TaxID=2998507 RepID=A0A9X3F909_9BACT|nr:hypothetical protein [Prolixibacteraceae bacterium Z1-6]
MKNIFLHDTGLRLVKSIERCGDVQIHTLSTQNKYVNDQSLIIKQNSFLKDTVFLDSSTEVDFPYNELSLDYKIIEDFRPTQYRVEQYMARLGIEQYRVQYIYYRVLSYFYTLFKNGCIDLVITVLPVHGSPMEMIPIDMALYFKKPAYTFNIIFGKAGGYYLWGIWNHLKQEYTNLSTINDTPDLYDYLYDKIEKEFINDGKSLYEPSISKLSLTQKVSFIIRNLHKGNKKSAITSLMAKMPRVGFAYLYLTNNIYRRNYKDLKQTIKYYKKNSTKRIENGTKYVFYALHQDPEAQTLVWEKLSSQLTIMKILNDSLPQGWKLVVKDHPVYNSFLRPKKLREAWYFFFSIRNYRSKSFFAELLKNSNVMLADIDVPASNLIDNACAVASINGTISLEAAKARKPILLFGNKQVVSYAADVFRITSTDECKNVLRIIDEGFVPDYKDIKSLGSLTFEMHSTCKPEKSPLFDIDSAINKKLSGIMNILTK